MSFNFTAFSQKMNAVAAALPALGTLVQAAAAVAPNAAGLAKAGLVINTAIAAEPMLVGMEAILGAAITGIVNAYRSTGTIPATPANAAAAPAFSVPVVTSNLRDEADKRTAAAPVAALTGDSAVGGPTIDPKVLTGLMA